MGMRNYFGPYGGLLAIALFLTTAYYILSFKRYKDIHEQVFTVLWQSVKADLRLIILLIDPILFYLLSVFVVFLILIALRWTYSLMKGGSNMRQAELFAPPRNTAFLSKTKDGEHELKEVLGENYDEFKDMLKKYRELFIQALRIFKDLPASKGYHHAEAYGLFKHSVSVAYRLYKESERVAELLEIDKRTAEMVAVVLGLFHDAGKVYREIPFKLQNSIAAVMLGRLNIELPPQILSRIAYAITLQHTEYANLDPEPLLKILRSLDAEDTKADIEQRRRECITEFLSQLKKELESIHHEWNAEKYFKVIYNPKENELLVNMLIFDRVYEFLKKELCKVPKGEILSWLVNEGYVKPVNNNPFVSFSIEGVGKFPAVLFDLNKFPVRVPTVYHVPKYMPAVLKSERDKFLEAVKELVEEHKDRLKDPDSPVLRYKDKKDREWILLKSEVVKLLNSRGLDYTSLKDISERTGFTAEKVYSPALKLNKKVLKIPLNELGR